MITALSVELKPVATWLRELVSGSNRNILEKGAEAATTQAATSTADNGQSASIVSARHLLNGGLNNLQSLLDLASSELAPNERDLLTRIINQIKAGSDEISEQDRHAFLSLAEQITGITKAPKPDEPLSNAEQNSDTQNDASLKSNPVDYLTDSIKRILERELLNKNSWVGLIATFVGKSKILGTENVGSFIETNILTDGFKDALKNSILGNADKVNTKDFNMVQAKAFKVAKWSVWAIDKLPGFAISYIPLLTNVLKWALPFVTHIPKLGKLVATVYPLMDEAGAFLGKFQKETASIKEACAAIRKTHQTSQDSNSDPAPVSKPDPTPAILTTEAAGV